MLALSLSMALASAGSSSDVPQLDVAEPDQVAAAVDSCRSAVAGSNKIDEATLSSDGWRITQRPNKSGNVFRKPGAPAVILTLGAPLAGSCFVRARLEDDASIETASRVIEHRLGVPARRKEGDPVYRLWRKDRQLVGFEAFDDGPRSQHYVIQLVVGELLKEFR